MEHRLHDRGHARHHDYIADPEAGAPDILLRMRSAPLGMHVLRRRASFISAPVDRTRGLTESKAIPISYADRQAERGVASCGGGS